MSVDPKPSRPEAIRRLLTAALDPKGGRGSSPRAWAKRCKRKGVAWVGSNVMFGSAIRGRGMASGKLRLWTGIAGLIALLALTDPTLGAGLYRCHAKDAVSLADDGTLGRNKVTEYWRQVSEDVIVDTTTGAIRFGDADPQTWKIVQNGDFSNDFVAVPQFTPAPAPSDTIRVRAWQDMKTVLFIRYGLLMMVTGTCEPIQ